MRISDWSSDVCSSDLIDPIDLSAWRQMESELPADWEPISLQQTSEKDELAQVRLQNASATLSSIDRDKPDVTADVYYKAGIVEIGRASCRESECQYV